MRTLKLLAETVFSFLASSVSSERCYSNSVNVTGNKIIHATDVFPFGMTIIFLPSQITLLNWIYVRYAKLKEECIGLKTRVAQRVE